MRLVFAILGTNPTPQTVDLWHELALGLLPTPLAAAMLDCALSEGPRRAVVLMRAAIGVRYDEQVDSEMAVRAQRCAAMSVIPDFFARRVESTVKLTGAVDRQTLRQLYQVCHACMQAQENIDGGKLARRAV